jgi:hypothetical protein
MTGPMLASARTLDLAAPHEALKPLPPGTLGEGVIGIAYLDPATEPQRVVVAYVRKDLPGLDLSDPRAVRVTLPSAKQGSRAEVRDYLTQISHLRVARSTDGHYSMGALLLDAEDPTRVTGRSPEPILVASEEYEQSGFYNNTVFSCGLVPLDDRGKRIRMYYGAADCRMAAADFDVKAILASLAPC